MARAAPRVGGAGGGATGRGYSSGGPQPGVAQQGPELRPSKKLGIDLLPRCPLSERAGGGLRTAASRPKIPKYLRQHSNTKIKPYLSLVLIDKIHKSRGR
ncbi:hypothetical protein EVAR_47937_1 [Eumeta japonica]|uniref:Uncharacterized protein n=1 Tax=Eumeta variegata TaxID=151549 RepID=A0A4C1Y6K6_EUMVA|nr:hypothetical protein EVAR_47937_1 [Eumeta japonica]